MKILMVGGGAVGQVFGLHLQNAGVELGFYARPESAVRLKDALEKGGLPLYQVSHSHRKDPIQHRLVGYQVLTDVESARSFAPDQIWFATPSTVLYSDWFRDFIAQVPAERVVCFAPEGGRTAFAPQDESTDRLVLGGVSFIAWQGDLGGGGGGADGVNYWLPPLIEQPIMGSEEASREIAGLLKRGGLRPAVRKPDFGKSQAAVSALLSTFVAGVELSGWSLRSFRRGPWLKQAAYGTQEAVLSQLPDPGMLARGLLRLLASPIGFSLASRLLPYLFPFDFERYLEFHFTKVRDQTLHLLDLYASDGMKRGMLVGHIQTLQQGLMGN